MDRRISFGKFLLAVRAVYVSVSSHADGKSQGRLIFQVVLKGRIARANVGRAARQNAQEWGAGHGRRTAQ
jgi:hypothetical protein